jgi:hypothetical protein
MGDDTPREEGIMRQSGNHADWFAQRRVRGLAEDGGEEYVTIWIERRPGAVWAVGRAVSLEERLDGQVRADDYVFDGYEMGDAVEAANQALESDLEIAGADGIAQQVVGFVEDELRGPLERWFFGRPAT